MLSLPGAKNHQEPTNLPWWQRKQNDFIQINRHPKYAELHSEINYMGWLSIVEHALTALYFFSLQHPLVMWFYCVIKWDVMGLCSKKKGHLVWKDYAFAVFCHSERMRKRSGDCLISFLTSCIVDFNSLLTPLQEKCLHFYTLYLSLNSEVSCISATKSTQTLKSWDLPCMV